MTTTITQSNISYKNVSKQSILTRKIHILSNIRIKKRLDMSSYLNTTIHTRVINNKECIIAFDNEEFLFNLKERCKHPYYISSPAVDDIIFYINQTKNDIIIYNDVKNSYTYIDINTMKSKSMISLSESDDINELILGNAILN